MKHAHYNSHFTRHQKSVKVDVSVWESYELKTTVNLTQNAIRYANEGTGYALCVAQIYRKT